MVYEHLPSDLRIEVYPGIKLPDQEAFGALQPTSPAQGQGSMFDEA